MSDSVRSMTTSTDKSSDECAANVGSVLPDRPEGTLLPDRADPVASTLSTLDAIALSSRRLLASDLPYPLCASARSFSNGRKSMHDRRDHSGGWPGRSRRAGARTFGGLLRRRILPPPSHQVIQTSQISRQAFLASSSGVLFAQAPHLVIDAARPSPNPLEVLVADVRESSVLVALRMAALRSWAAL